jgi:hypothetical protein
MALQQITADDISGWDSLDAIASSFEKRGLKQRPKLGDENELVLQLSDTDFIVLVEAGPGESASEFKPDNLNRHTNLVATNNYEDFTFLTRVRSWEGQQHGRIRHQKLSFTKSQFQSDAGEKNTILKKLNSIEYGSKSAVTDSLYDTKRVVKEFYEQFEELRTNLVQEVAGIPDNRGDAKQRYVQVLLDRMIFLYFIQEKRLLDRNNNYLQEKHEEAADNGKDVYTDFYEPLFFEMLAEGRQDPDFGSLPYLNGGLFSKNPIEEEFEDARLGESPDETDELFTDILDFLSEWNWNVDERLDIVDPKNLSPAILGHIFEQTVNQKEMGAYYTPEEITGFMGRRTVHPYLLDQLNEAVDANYDELDELFGFSAPATDSTSSVAADGGTVTRQASPGDVQTNHVERLYHDILSDTRILDPAVGSGAFLLAVQEVLLDIYLQCIEHFQELDANGRGWELESRTREELQKIENSKGGASLYAKRQIILDNLYGVDIDDGAVEICKLRLWLSMVADIEDEPSEVEPLPNIDFNIRQGNSLIGFTDVQETATEDGDYSLTNFGGGIGESVEEMYDDVIDAVERHRNAKSSQEASNARKIAESHIKEHSDTLDEKVLEQFKAAGVEDITLDEVQDYSPFHWVLEFATVYRDGKFDVVIGNPPWDVLTSDKDEFFTKYDPQFRTYPDSKKEKVVKEKLSESEISSAWEKHQEHPDILGAYFRETPSYDLQSPDIGGQGKTDLSLLFLERIFDLSSSDGYTSVVMPGKLFTGTSGKDLRLHLLDETTVHDIIGFENKGIFQGVDDRQKFGILSYHNQGQSDNIRCIFLCRDTSILKDIEQHTFDVPAEVLRQYSPKTAIFPQVENERELNIIDTITNHVSIGTRQNDEWYIDLYREELNRTRDSDRFVETESNGEYPVYGGGNIWQYHYDSTLREDINKHTLWSVEEETDPEKSAKKRIREKNLRRLKKEIYESFDGTGSQIGFVNDLLEESRGEGLQEEDVLLDCTEYRIGLRHISNNTNERSLVAAVLPKGVVCHDKCPNIRPYEIDPSRNDLSDSPLHSVYRRIFSDKELFVTLGILNSISFDYIIRTKLDTSLSMNMLGACHAPKLTKGDNWFEYISERSAKLNCYGAEFSDMRKRLGGIEPVTKEPERKRLQAQIDAAAFHAYGFDRQDVKFILDDFHRVKNPRVMTEKYFDMVFEEFDQLKKEGPHP